MDSSAPCMEPESKENIEVSKRTLEKMSGFVCDNDAQKFTGKLIFLNTYIRIINLFWCRIKSKFETQLRRKGHRFDSRTITKCVDDTCICAGSGCYIDVYISFTYLQEKDLVLFKTLYLDIIIVTKVRKAHARSSIFGSRYVSWIPILRKPTVRQ